MQLQQSYTYAVPDHLVANCTVGKRVIVQFAAKKIYTALVISVHSNTPTEFVPKEVMEVMDDRPIVAPVHLRFWKWIADYYLASQGEVYRAAIPSVMKLESESFIQLHANVDAKQVEEYAKNEIEQIILHFLSDGKKSIKDLQKHINAANPLRVIKRLIDREVIQLYEKLSDLKRSKIERLIAIAPHLTSDATLSAAIDGLRSAKKQHQLFLCLMEFCTEASAVVELFPKHQVPRKVLLEKAGVSATILKALLEKDLVVEIKKEISYFSNDGEPKAIPELSAPQLEAHNAILKCFETKQTVLLHGVTGSGKTEIYIHQIQKTIDAGKQVLYLLPEIALTTQIIQRLQVVFGNKIGIYHSKFESNERAEVWESILKNNLSPNTETCQVVVGVRSALFLPFTELGLIIIDEEHENSFKQYDPAPRYHARDAALMLAHLQKAKVLLGSATPSVESYHNVQEKKYGYVQLTQRFHSVALPEILISDTKEALRKKQMKSIFSRFLLDKIEAALAIKEQVILFQNRRGYSPYVQCNACGTIPNCEHCDVSLTYHMHTQQLTCHYCGYSITLPPVCSKCASPLLETKGFGTEKIEDELSIFFPEARVQRLDLDSTRKKNAFENIIHQFQNQEVDILVGTQMVTKGLDFDNVNLVGVMNADGMLSFPDFRANERSFQLLVQVAGRAGRKHKQGQVIIQTAQPDHPVLSYVTESDSIALLNDELEERRLFRYPPFVRVIRINVKHKDVMVAKSTADRLLIHLKQVPNLEILGPQKPLIGRIRGSYVWIFMLKLTNKEQLNYTKQLILRAVEHTKLTDRKAIIQFDVDPF